MTSQISANPRARDGFRALRHPGYRVYLAGMLLRGTAVWMQLVSLPWLAIELDAGPAALGLIVGLQFLPTLFIAPLGGVLADRADRARVLSFTQIGSLVQGVGLFVLAASGSASIPALVAFALTFGVLTAIELPVRQAYLTELVPPEDITSAVSLHAMAWNTTRFIGPGIAGIIIATIGVAWSFLISGFVALAVAGSIVWLERHRFHRAERSVPTEGVIRSLVEGARFAYGEPAIRWALVLVTAGGIFGIQAFQTLAPLFVSGGLALDGGAYGAFVAVWGGGAVVASYVVTVMANADRRRWLIGGAGGMAVILACLSFVRLPAAAFVLVALLGFAQIALAQNAMILVQAASPDALRGRVMGLYTTMFQGMSPFGAFLAGWLAWLVGVRPAILVVAVALGAVAVAASVALRRSRQTSTS